MLFVSLWDASQGGLLLVIPCLVAFYLAVSGVRNLLKLLANQSHLMPNRGDEVVICLDFSWELRFDPFSGLTQSGLRGF